MGSSKVQTGGNQFTLHGSDYDVGSYDVAAKCGTSVKKIKVYVVNPRYQVFVEMPDTNDPSKIINIFDLETNSYNVGHAWWKIFVTPATAKDVIPFKPYDSVINNPVGFYGNGNVFAGDGKIAATTPTLHIPDTGHTQNKSQFYNISITSAISGLTYTKNMLSPSQGGQGAGDYILVQELIFGEKDLEGEWEAVYIHWGIYSPDHNCASTSRAAGLSSNADVPSSFTNNGVGNIGLFDYEFTGDSPAKLGSTLE